MDTCLQMAYRNDIYIKVRRLRIMNLRRIALSSVVCRSFCRSVSPAKTAEMIKLPFVFRTRVGPMNHVLNDVKMPTWEGSILREGNRQTTVKCRDTPRSSVQRWLNQSRCHLRCGLAWAESIMCYMGGPDTRGKEQFWWTGAPIVKYRHFLP